MQNYRDLQVWKKGIELAQSVYQAAKRLPKEESYGLSDQMRRAAVSIPSNIAEGCARGSDREFAHFLSIAQGSVAELETQIILCRNFNFFDEETEKNSSFSLKKKAKCCALYC